MNEIIRLKIDVTKLDKSAFHTGAKGTYADITLLANRDGEDQYGNHYMAVQDLGKERREAGEKGAIIGNAKIVSRGGQQSPAPARTTQPSQDDGLDDVPF